MNTPQFKVGNKIRFLVAHPPEPVGEILEISMDGGIVIGWEDHLPSFCPPDRVHLLEVVNGGNHE